ncbi:hypothetical protein [Parasediminibacterium sp. JCM 36343]|uniref:hypothetical protein n=1 Tax=Parasediminibacterium sp. JCM 36343 TaxID=3374279 RepID=UPI00397D9183
MGTRTTAKIKSKQKFATAYDVSEASNHDMQPLEGLLDATDNRQPCMAILPTPTSIRRR